MFQCHLPDYVLSRLSFLLPPMIKSIYKLIIQRRSLFLTKTAMQAIPIVGNKIYRGGKLYF